MGRLRNGNAWGNHFREVNVALLHFLTLCIYRAWVDLWATKVDGEAQARAAPTSGTDTVHREDIRYDLVCFVSRIKMSIKYIRFTCLFHQQGWGPQNGQWGGYGGGYGGPGGNYGYGTLILSTPFAKTCANELFCLQLAVGGPQGGAGPQGGYNWNWGPGPQGPNGSSGPAAPAGPGVPGVQPKPDASYSTGYGNGNGYGNGGGYSAVCEWQIDKQWWSQPILTLKFHLQDGGQGYQGGYRAENGAQGYGSGPGTMLRCSFPF